MFSPDANPSSATTQTPLGSIAKHQFAAVSSSLAAQSTESVNAGARWAPAGGLRGGLRCADGRSCRRASCHFQQFGRHFAQLVSGHSEHCSAQSCPYTVAPLCCPHNCCSAAHMQLSLHAVTHVALRYTYSCRSDGCCSAAHTLSLRSAAHIAVHALHTCSCRSGMVVAPLPTAVAFSFSPARDVAVGRLFKKDPVMGGETTN